MVFSSVLFLFRFLPIFMILYFATYLCPAARRMRNVILFLGSLFFYAWGEPVYVALLLFSTLSDYTHGMVIDRYRNRKIAKVFLISSIIINLGVLGFFKYADFVIGIVNQVTGVQMPLLELPLPIGISFYTFQTMSYTIDVYREIDEAMDEDDISLDQFNDDIDQWIIDLLKNQGLTTARQVLGTSREELIDKTDLEDETVDEIIRILSAEFEK
mgnify:CR=1 FL=1